MHTQMHMQMQPGQPGQHCSVKQEEKGSTFIAGQPVAASSNYLLPFDAPLTAAKSVAHRASHPSATAAAAAQASRRGGGAGGSDEEGEDCDALPRGGGTTALETDPRRLEQRQKQIDLGKATQEYKTYSILVPMSVGQARGEGRGGQPLSRVDCDACHSCFIAVCVCVCVRPVLLVIPPCVTRPIL